MHGVALEGRAFSWKHRPPLGNIRKVAITTGIHASMLELRPALATNLLLVSPQLVRRARRVQAN
jgi:hypothetical protein